jgi:transposase
MHRPVGRCDLVGALPWHPECPVRRPGRWWSRPSRTRSATTADQSAGVILGVDTHAQVHVACLLDQLGRPLGTLTIPVTTAGFHQLVAWASRHGRLIRAGVEGTGTYGAGLTRHLT